MTEALLINPEPDTKPDMLKLADLPPEARLRLLEDKIAFLMQVVQVPVQKSVLDTQPTILPALSVYLMMKSQQIRAKVAPNGPQAVPDAHLGAVESENG